MKKVAPAPARRPAGAAPKMGWRWRLTNGFTARSRGRRFDLFTELMCPSSSDAVLDLGVTDRAGRSANFFEERYPWPERITAVSPWPASEFARSFPHVRLEIADGRQLPFADGEFDLGFSNAVIEHVGSRVDQRRFVGELVRTCRRVFLSTPNAAFPIDPHTLLPFVHWLPRALRHPLLRMTGNARWASEAALNPLGADALIGLFPVDTEVRLVRQRVLGMTTVLIAVTTARDQ